MAMADDEDFSSSSIPRSSSGSSGGSSSGSTKSVIRPWSKLSSKKSKSSSSSPWLSPLRQRQLIQPVSTPAPPCSWDVEFPRASSPSRQQKQHPKRECVKLRRSLSLLERPTPPPACSVRRSLWSKESKEALHMRLGVYLDAMPEETIPSSPSTAKEEGHVEQPDKSMAMKQQQSPSSTRSSDDASSIFSSKKSLSFSSSSERCSTARQEHEQEQEEREDRGGFLDYTLVRGHLVLPDQAATVTAADRDHRDTRRHCGEAKEEEKQECRPEPSCPSYSTPPSQRERVKNKTMAVMDEDGGNGDGGCETRNRHVARRLQFSSSPGPPRSLVSSPTSSKTRSSASSDGGDLLKSLLDSLPRALMRKRRSSSSTRSRAESCSSLIRAAHLHCAIQHDHYSYTYIVDGSDERILARAPRNRQHRYDLEEEDKEVEDEEDLEELEVCSFYSWKRGSSRGTKSRSMVSLLWPSPTDSSSRPHEASETVAVMRLKARNNRSNLELQFILDDHRPSQKGGEAVMDNTRLSFSSWQSSISSSAFKNPPRMNKIKKSLSLNSSPVRGKIADDHGEELDILRDVWKQMEADRAAAARSRKTTNPAQELAAIAIKLPPSSSKNLIQRRNTSVESSPDHTFAAMSVTAVLPVGEHGLPDHHLDENDASDQSSPDHGNGTGPSSLIERWKRGRCDCGGWDLGCALHILERNPESRDRNALDISLQIQGGRSQPDRDCFNLIGMNNGLFSVRFKAPLSALQAFATAVAILHATRVNHGQSSRWSRAGLPTIPTTDAHLERL